MYRNHRVKHLLIVGFMLSFGLGCGVFGFDLLEEIEARIQKFGDSLSSDSYMSRVYSPDFSKDPFGDAVSNQMDIYNKPRSAGVQYVKKSLKEEGCSMSDKKIIGILYYFVPGFKENLERDMKIELGEYNSKKYELDVDDVIKYCGDFYACSEKKRVSTCSERDGGTCVKRNWPELGGLSANLETRCKEFFEGKYYEGEYNEYNKQKVKVSQIGVDKYRNNTVDDSPYDIMEDFGELAKLLYFEAQDPITPVFYHMPNFSNSENALRKGKDPSVSSNGETPPSDNGGTSGTSPSGSSGDGEEREEEGGDNGDHENHEDGDLEGEEPSGSSVSPLGIDEVPDYDDLLEGLGAYRLTSDGSEFYTNLCDNREGTESEVEEDSNENYDFGGEFSDVDDISEEEYEEIVDYMLDAVDDYKSLSSEKKDEIDKVSGDKIDFGSESSAEDLEKRADEIKNCWKSCEGLRVDQKASCMVKCSCGEITSADDEIFGVKNRVKLFDLEEFPSLGPVLIIRFCAVPAVDTRFSVGGKRIHSIEEGLNEIYGVVDKLSREGKLGKWTQQYEFLDSSTKRMNFADSFAFTIDVEFVNVSNKMSKRSKQFQKRELKNSNETQCYGIKNPLDTSVGVDRYSTISDPSSVKEESVGDSTNSEKSDNLQNGDDGCMSFVDLFEDAYADIHVTMETHSSSWLSQQWELWNNTEEYMKTLIDAAKLLNSKNTCN